MYGLFFMTLELQVDISVRAENDEIDLCKGK